MSKKERIGAIVVSVMFVVVLGLVFWVYIFLPQVVVEKRWMGNDDYTHEIIKVIIYETDGSVTEHPPEWLGENPTTYQIRWVE